MFRKLFPKPDERLLKRFLKDSNNRTLEDLLAFLVSHQQPLPFDNQHFRDTLFRIDTWKLDVKYQSFLMSSVKDYLFDPVQPPQTHEWEVWLATAEVLNHDIDVLAPNAVEKIRQAYNAGKLQKLSEQSFMYLVHRYPKAYRDVLGETTPEIWVLKFPLLLELIQLSLSVIVAKDNDKRKYELAKLLVFLEEHTYTLPIEDAALRDALFKTDFWDLKLVSYDRIFDAIERYLFGNIRDSQEQEWKAWVKAHMFLNRRINVMEPAVARSLRDAERANKLIDLPAKEREYLLQNYLRIYGNMLEEMEPGNKDALPLLLEFASIAQIIGPSDFSMRILERWTKDLPARPRSLTTLRDEQALFAPIIGVGSPHGVSITQYYRELARLPKRIVAAGVTGDPSLNAQIFTALFSTALACDTEPTFITSVGALLNLDVAEREPQENVDKVENRFRDQVLLHAVLGPDGPREPTTGMPRLGMDLDDALTLVRDMFERFEEATGLVQIKRWQISDAERFDHKIREMFEATGEGSVMKSDLRRTEGSGLIHITPWLHRDEKGEVVPISISLPYDVFGAESIFKLVCEARQLYMKQLIAACQHRKMLAERTFREQTWGVLQWQRLSEEEKRSIIQNAPTIEINEQINFELGIVIKLSKPEAKPRTIYETETRPMLRDQAKFYSEKFTKLEKRLTELNQVGGRADVLTFKLLVDSLIRQATPPIANTSLQKEYEDWQRNNSDIVWKTMHEWAEKRGLSVDLLAVDNILFNTRLDNVTKNVSIEPWIMVDLHDFVAYVDKDRGLMEVYPGGKTPTLTETVIPDADHNLITPQDLLLTFYSWLDKSLNLQALREQEEAEIRSKILGDPDIHTLLQLQIAKRLLWNGNAQEAAEILAEIRRQDLAAIYFWGAVAHQYLFLQDKNVEFRLGLEKEEGAGKIERLINIAISNFIEVMSPPKPDFRIDLATREMTFASPPPPPLDEEAERYLAQMLERDKDFGTGLVQQKNIYLIERQSLHISRDDEARLQAAISALSALELLKLAEDLKDVAKKLPFSGMWTYDLKGYVDKVVEHSNSMRIRQSSVSDEINQLRKLI